MKINTALILCAGFGKRLNPITLNTPKPLLEIKDVSMLERCINLIEKLGIQKILINTFYLKDQFSVFLNSKNFNLNIKNKIVMIENADPGFDWIFAHKISGLVTKYGGVNSHMAIRCAELDIPAAIGCGEKKFESLKGFKLICLDCSSSSIYNI